MSKTIRFAYKYSTKGKTYFIQEEKDGILQASYWSSEKKGKFCHHLQRWLNHYAAGESLLPSIPEHIGTPFQKKVWREIQLIQPGYVMTYKELARRIGSPKAYKAVAQACRANKLALIIPCHRVVGVSGVGGFAWGESLKKDLLFDEGLIEHPLSPSIKKNNVKLKSNSLETGKVISRIYKDGCWWYLVDFLYFQDWFTSGSLT